MKKKWIKTNNKIDSKKCRKKKQNCSSFEWNKNRHTHTQTHKQSHTKSEAAMGRGEKVGSFRLANCEFKHTIDLNGIWKNASKSANGCARTVFRYCFVIARFSLSTNFPIWFARERPTVRETAKEKHFVFAQLLEKGLEWNFKRQHLFGVRLVNYHEQEEMKMLTRITLQLGKQWQL